MSQSTLGDRVPGLSCSKEEASAQKQKLTEAEEDVLSQYLIYMSENNLAISVQSAATLSRSNLSTEAWKFEYRVWRTLDHTLSTMT